eukprot:10951831-Alexandrium_andersonii.AAC.1
MGRPTTSRTRTEAATRAPARCRPAGASDAPPGGPEWEGPRPTAPPPRKPPYPPICEVQQPRTTT